MTEVRICDGHKRAGVTKHLDPRDKNVRAYIAEQEFDLCPDCVPHYRQFRKERDELTAKLQEKIADEERLIEERFWQRIRNDAAKQDRGEARYSA